MITLNKSHTLEVEIKKSRFIAHAERAESIEQALEFIKLVSESDANHNCWAYKVGKDYRFTDDGEPGGTAGRPILAAIEGQGVENAVVVVTRYFGGIKLGTGGLVRAYGGTAASCLREAEKLELKPRTEFLLCVPYEETGVVFNILNKSEAEKLGESHTEKGLELKLLVDTDIYSDFEKQITNATRGKAEMTIVSVSER